MFNQDNVKVFANSPRSAYTKENKIETIKGLMRVMTASELAEMIHELSMPYAQDLADSVYMLDVILEHEKQTEIDFGE